MMVYPPCPKKYVQDGRLPMWNLNAIPVKIVSHTIDFEGETFGPFNFYQVYFPRPWIITGLVDLLQMPDTNPGYPESYSIFMTPAKHNTYKSLPGAILIDFAYANTQEYNVSNPVNYVRPGTQEVDYRGYFSKYLNDLSMIEREQAYNSLIQPESILRRFFVLNAAATDIDWGSRWAGTLDFLKTTMDKKLMGAPGVYEIIISETQWNGVPDWMGRSEYETVNNL